MEETVKKELQSLIEQKKEITNKLQEVCNVRDFLSEENKKIMEQAKEGFNKQIKELDAKILEYKITLETYNCSSYLKESVGGKVEKNKDVNSQSGTNFLTEIEMVALIFFIVFLIILLMLFLGNK